VSRFRSLYESHLKPLSTRIGVHEYFRDVYWSAKLYRNQTVSQTIGDTTVLFGVNNRSEFLRFRDLGGERTVIEDLLSEVKRDDVVFDIGANVGTYTCFVAKQISAAHVVAFEPHPANLKGLRSNLRRNDSDAVIVKKALADSGGVAELEVVSSKIGEGKHSLATDNGSETIEVEMRTGDELVEAEAIPQPSIVKVDVEGAEGRVLEGLEDSLSRPACRLCYVEVHASRLPDYGDTEVGIVSTLEDCGFEVSEIYHRGSEFYLKGQKRR